MLIIQRSTPGSTEKESSSKSMESKSRKSERKRPKQDKERQEKSRRDLGERSSKPPRASRRSMSGSRSSRQEQEQGQATNCPEILTRNILERDKSQDNIEILKPQKKEADKVRAGHQPWVPTVRITRRSALDKDESSTKGHEDDDYDRNIPVIKPSTYENEGMGSRSDNRRRGNSVMGGRKDRQRLGDSFDDLSTNSGDIRGRRYSKRGGRAGSRGSGRGRSASGSRSATWLKKDAPGP